MTCQRLNHYVHNSRSSSSHHISLTAIEANKDRTRPSRVYVWMHRATIFDLILCINTPNKTSAYRRRTHQPSLTHSNPTNNHSKWNIWWLLSLYLSNWYCRTAALYYLKSNHVGISCVHFWEFVFFFSVFISFQLP